MRFYRRLQPIAALSFDLDDTLYDNPPVLRRAEQRLVEWLSVEVQQHAAGQIGFWREHKRGVLLQRPQLSGCSTQWRRYTLRSGLAVLGYRAAEAEAVAERALSEFLRWRSEIVVPEATLQLLADLAQRYPLAAISNGNADVGRFMAQIPFACVLQAGRDGPMKPAPDLFHRCCDTLAIAPSQLLHVGDHPDTDVAGALNAGCQAVWLDPRPDGRPRAPGTRLPTVQIADLQSLRELI
ncbi:HAD-IA family hydrolase [Ferrimonas pelagia]|uniref:5-amino-6-(5-phospho-D-ribitylamino)uracil phosphatase YigB n=1 Tax=Ferrimonas pelagia TaxID=1177826 RepID=A0ABP9EH60_9GAMM